MKNAEEIINAVCRSQSTFGLATCFVVRAIRQYSRQIVSSDVASLKAALPGEKASDWKRAAIYVSRRLEAAQVRGASLNAEFFRELAATNPQRDVMRRFLLRAVTNYAAHIASMPHARISHSLRGIEAWKWKHVANEIHNAVETILAFNRTTA